MSSFLEQALVFFGSAIILVPIFQRLRFGSVLGYLMAGILVGPQGLGLIPSAESVIHFSEFGVVLLLFIIGLEIQPAKLWSMRNHLLGLGGVQIVLSSLLFTAVGYSFGLPMVGAGVIGLALSLSSTAFAMQTLVERNQLTTEFGRTSFAVLLMQDLVAIPALAIIPSLAVPNSGEEFSFKGILLVVGVVAFLFVSSRLLMRPAFRLIASTRSREIFTAATLFVVLGVAALMQKVGVSAALGTFIAGVLLADSEYRHELEANLDPFKSLLMGLFFIGVGMSVSLELFFHQPFLVLGLAVGYLVIKASIIYLAGRMFKLKHQTAKNMALTIAQGGEFAFVIFGIALQYKLVPSETLALLTAVITASMALNPILSVFSEFLSRRWAQSPIAPKYDEIKDETPQVIIAGMGRFGQMFGRVLRAQQIPFVAIDHDPEQIDLLRKFDNKVYYGDATRSDLLEAAGAAKAKFLVLAIDDVEASMQAAQMVVEHFPHLKIFARVRNRTHAFDIMDLGISSIKRETADSAIYFVGDLLVAMGVEPRRAATIVQKFKRHDEIMLLKQFQVRHDDEQFVSVSKQGMAQLAQVLEEDSSRSYVDASDVKSLQQ